LEESTEPILEKEIDVLKIVLTPPLCTISFFLSFM